MDTDMGKLRCLGTPGGCPGAEEELIAQPRNTLGATSNIRRVMGVLLSISATWSASRDRPAPGSRSGGAEASMAASAFGATYGCAMFERPRSLVRNQTLQEDGMEFGMIEREIFVEASPEIVFDVVSSPDHLKQWWP